MTTRGMNRATGRELVGIDHLRQSIADILTTRKGTRVMRRDYGSELPALVDRPINAELQMELYAETVLALETWEPRLKVKEVSITRAAPGEIELYMVADYLPDGRTINISGIIVR